MSFTPKLQWDQTGERFYETGDKRAVLYPRLLQFTPTISSTLS